jgi:hypothetical protein
VLVDRHGRKLFLKSLIKTIAYLASAGAIPEDEIKRMVRSREPLINGFRVYYY